MTSDRTPLVSVCVTFLNGEQFVSRIIESCLRQTYQNLQIVLVDDASTDKSGEMIKEYAAKDSRIKYHRNPEKVGLTKSVQQMYELADGEYIIWLGVDDWLAHDAIEQGVKSFLEHPGAGAVMPRVVSLREISPTKFEYIGDNSKPTGTYSTEWVAREAYRGLQSALCLFAFFRKEDALAAVKYFLENCCYNPNFPEELRNLALKKAYAPDFVFFLDVLSKYKGFVSNYNCRTIKILHGSNLAFKDVSRNTASKILQSEYYRIIFFDPIYKQKYSAFYSGMKINTRAQSISEIVVGFLRSGLRPSFFNFAENKSGWHDLFKDLSDIEAVGAVLLSIPMAVYRFLVFVARKAWAGITAAKDRMTPYYAKENFLDREAGFKV